jgi:hypothetical protein
MKSFEARFWEKVSRADGDGCWLWAGSLWKGYGRLRLPGGRYGSAHRAAWGLTFGVIPDGMCICHHCDNPRCVRPDHLFLGTRRDNNRDRWEKGRYDDTHGERHPGAKLTEDTVRLIRVSEEAGITLAARYGVTPTTISDVRKGRTWGTYARSA